MGRDLVEKFDSVAHSLERCGDGRHFLEEKGLETAERKKKKKKEGKK